MGQSLIRLCVDQPLAAGQYLPLDEAQARYLFSVMRLAAGAEILVFNGRDGEWRARLTPAGRRGGHAVCLQQVRPQERPADLWLVFAPVKKARTDFIIEKAVELGVARLCPVQTEFTSAERLRRDKALAHVREAAEQCGALWIAEVDELAPLDRVLAGWNPARRLLWADETLAGLPPDGRAPTARPFADLPAGQQAVLVGPEGGFSPRERARLGALPFILPVSLGPRILRAETAALAMLTLWQSHRGDWQ